MDLYAMFNEELNMAKKEFSKQSSSLPSSHPPFAGAATWVRSLKKKIDLPMKVTCLSGHSTLADFTCISTIIAVRCTCS